MEKRIVYQDAGGVTCVITPVLASGLTIEEIAAKDVPSGLSWQIVDEDQAPADLPVAQELSREAFCVALINAGILTEAEATSAALGAWPAAFEPALDGKSLVEKLTAKNLWREVRTVPRDAPLFVDILAFYKSANGLTDAQAEAMADAIFAGAA